VWSFPETRDEGERWIGPVRVAWRTAPSPDDLLRTERYTAFGALYEDTTRVERPGEAWDRLLAQFAAGDRSRPVWGFDGSPTFYRLDVRGSGRLLSNPIFVKRS
jgi:hypothetical protein